MKERKPVNILEIAALAMAIGIAALLLAPRVGRSGDALKDRATAEGASVINMALKDYASKNRGSFPEAKNVAGGEAVDELILGSALIKYPKNPFSQNGEKMKNVSKDSASPGNFSYTRNPKVANDYELIAYGKHGVVFKYHKEIMK